MKVERLIGPLAISLVTAALVLGFREVGTPGHARTISLDQLRVDRLASTAMALHRAYGLGHPALPVVPRRTILEVDPVTSTPLEYRRLTAVRYVLCAVFDGPSEEKNDVADNFYPQEHFPHGSGRACYVLRVTDDAPDPQPFDTRESKPLTKR
jgi:hypothetical protein